MHGSEIKESSYFNGKKYLECVRDYWVMFNFTSQYMDFIITNFIILKEEHFLIPMYSKMNPFLINNIQNDERK